jgi:hypothetical protein
MFRRKPAPAHIQSEEKLEDKLSKCKNLAHIVSDLAKANDRDGLKQFVTEHYGVDIISQSGMTPCGSLAAENEVNGVMLLIEEFNASVNYAVYWAAYGNHPKLVQLLIERGAETSSAIYGAARGGHVDLAGTLRNEDKSITQSAIETSAARGNCLKSFIPAGKESVLSATVIRRSIAEGAEINNQRDYVDSLIKNEAEIESKRDFVRGAMEGTAASGDITRLEHLISQGNFGHSIDNILYDSRIMDIAAYNGQGALVAHLHKKSPLFFTLDSARNYAIEGGHKMLADCLTRCLYSQDSLSKQKTDGFISVRLTSPLSGNAALLEYVYHQYLKMDERLFFYYNNFPKAQLIKILGIFHDLNFRQEFLSGSHPGFNDSDRALLLQQAERLHENYHALRLTPTQLFGLSPRLERIFLLIKQAAILKELSVLPLKLLVLEYAFEETIINNLQKLFSAWDAGQPQRELHEKAQCLQLHYQSSGIFFKNRKLLAELKTTEQERDKTPLPPSSFCALKPPG